MNMKSKQLSLKVASVVTSMMLTASPMIALAEDIGMENYNYTDTQYQMETQGQTDFGASNYISPWPPYHNTLNATVGQSQPDQRLIVHSITPVKTTGTADNTFQNGWKWVFDVSVPLSETNLSMRFNNWMATNTSYTMPSANNMRFYSAQSSNAQTQNTAIYITSPNTYSQPMMLNGTVGGAPVGMRRVHITVETKIPNGTPGGNYSTSFGILTQ